MQITISCGWIRRSDPKRDQITVLSLFRCTLQCILKYFRRADHMIRTTGTKEESGRAALSLWQDAVKRASETGGNKRHE